MKVKKPYTRIYKGVFYYYSPDKNKWYCDLLDYPEKRPFDTQKGVKQYINDYIDNRDYETTI